MLHRLTSIPLALMLVTSPAVHAQSGSYDGRWTVVAVTEQGSCDVYRIDLAVNGGRINERGFVISAAGQVDKSGRVSLTVAGAGEQLGATGRLAGADGSGRWSAPGRQCSGRWTASRKA